MAAEDISVEDFRAFVRMRDSGRFNMATQCGAAAHAEGISLAKHIEIIMNFSELAARYSEVFEKPAKKPAKKPRCSPNYGYAKESPNCGYLEESFVVQRRIPAVERSKDWRDFSGDLPSFERACDFIEGEKRIRKMSNGPKREFRIVRKRVEAFVLFETAE